MRGPLPKVFPDALLNRLLVVPYYPINGKCCNGSSVEPSRVEKRVQINHKVPFTCDEACRTHLETLPSWSAARAWWTH
jgi:type VI secretion system protein VasG